jgi:hypothetical protein
MGAVAVAGTLGEDAMNGIARIVVCVVVVLGLLTAPLAASAAPERGERSGAGWVDGFVGWLISVVTAGDGEDDDEDRGPDIDPDGVVGHSPTLEKPGAAAPVGRALLTPRG